MNNKILIIMGILVIVVIGFFIFSNGNSQITGNIISEGIEEEELIRISLSEISENAVWYNYGDIKYFVVKASDGSIKSAFDACDICYGSKKGYRQQGDDMICNNCGNYYSISGLGTKNLKGGGCWPGYLPSEIQGENLVIKKSDLEKGEYRFK